MEEPKISNIVNFSVEQLLIEINTYVESQMQNELMKEEDDKPKKKKVEAFDDFFGGGDSDDDDMDLMDFDSMAAKPKVKKVEEVKKEQIISKPENPDEKSAEQQFLEIHMELMENILKVKEDLADKKLIDFILVFK